MLRLLRFLHACTGPLALVLAIFALGQNYRQNVVDRLLEDDIDGRSALVRKELGENPMGKGTKRAWKMEEPLWKVVARHEAELGRLRFGTTERLGPISGGEAKLLGDNGFWDTILVLLNADFDTDGIRNLYDACPDIASMGETEDRGFGQIGCPDSPENDRDGDGVSDYRDACPDQGDLPSQAPPGAKILNYGRLRGPKELFPKDVGCLDSDGDNIDNRMDRCAGTLDPKRIDTRGCSPEDVLRSCGGYPLATPGVAGMYDFRPSDCRLAPREPSWLMRCEGDANVYTNCAFVKALTP